jgi:hypothetical protein
MPITAESRAGATQAAEKADSQFKPVPRGWYDGTIVEAKVQQYKSGKYAGKNYINTRLKVLKGAETGAGREFFFKVPLFSNWAPSQKYPDGYPTAYASFFQALGVSDSDIDAGRIPFEVSDLGGKPIGFFVTVEDADDYHDEEWNDVSRVRKSTAGTPGAVREAAGGDVWGTASEPTPSATEDVWATPASNALAAAASEGEGF